MKPVFGEQATRLSLLMVFRLLNTVHLPFQQVHITLKSVIIVIIMPHSIY